MRLRIKLGILVGLTGCLWLGRAATQQPVDRRVADALFDRGREYYQRYDYPAAQEAWRQALAIYRRLGLEKEAAGILHNLGGLAQTLGQYAEARGYDPCDLGERVLAICQLLGGVVIQREAEVSRWIAKDVGVGRCCSL